MLVVNLTLVLLFVLSGEDFDVVWCVVFLPVSYVRSLFPYEARVTKLSIILCCFLFCLGVVSLFLHRVMSYYLEFIENMLFINRFLQSSDVVSFEGTNHISTNDLIDELLGSGNELHLIAEVTTSVLKS